MCVPLMKRFSNARLVELEKRQADPVAVVIPTGGRGMKSILRIQSLFTFYVVAYDLLVCFLVFAMCSDLECGCFQLGLISIAICMIEFIHSYLYMRLDMFYTSLYIYIYIYI